MTARWRPVCGARSGVALAVALAVAAGCASRPSPSSPDPGASATTVSPAASAEPTPVLLERVPPEAMLGPAARPADGAIGQLGTYTWRGEGSSSPRLPGAPLGVRPGAPLTVILDPPVPVASWTATVGDPAVDDPGRTLGTSAGLPSLAAPDAGEWRLEIRMTFGGGLGDAIYAWHLSVE